jgi:hypothetical protein
MEEDRKPKIEKRGGMLFVEGEERGYTRKTVLEVRGDKLVILEGPGSYRTSPSFTADDIGVSFQHSLGYDSGELDHLFGTASLRAGQLRVIGHDGRSAYKVRFDFYRPWGGCPEWSGAITFGRGTESTPDSWFLTAYLPNDLYAELLGAYRRDALAELWFGIDSELWQRESPHGYSYDDVWYLPDSDDIRDIDSLRSNAGVVLSGFRWSERSRRVVEQQSTQSENHLAALRESFEPAFRWVVGLLCVIAVLLFIGLLRH